MKTILVPVDGSASSLNALKAAITMMREHGSDTLHVLNVQYPIVSGNVTRFISSEAIHDYYREEGEKMLASARALLTEAGISAQIKIEVGPPAKTIAQYVNDHHCDLVIMGTRGLGGVSGLVLGSITTKVLHLVNVPVTLIK
jgi:nucleotide-binding universal stress UspA family protein